MIRQQKQARALWIILIIFNSIICQYYITTASQLTINNDVDFKNLIRVKRQNSLSNSLPHQDINNQNTGTSILTVEWEGIHNQVSDDRTIGGFAVEYRSEAEPRWIQHKGIIPYHGPNIQYKVRIRDLPSGLVYYVRIKVLGRNNEVLLETPEIKAQSEATQLVCGPGEISEPRNVRTVATDMHTLTFEWDAPQCGTVVRYTFTLEGYDEFARMDFQTGSSELNRATLRNLLPGTSYTFRVRGADANRRLGPWTDTVARGSTEGSAPSVSHDIRVVYKTDKQIRVEWTPFVDGQLQHYELMILEETNEREGLQVYRVQVPPTETSYVFTNLRPSTNYHVGVIAFVNFQPRQVYRLTVDTARPGVGRPWPLTPDIRPKGVGKFAVYWERPSQFVDGDLQGFIIEFRLPNETNWRRYGDIISYRPDQKQFGAELSGLNDKYVYVIRVYLVNTKGEVVGVTDEFNLGSQSVTSCTGPSGVPSSVQALHSGPTSITFTWTRPRCDESYGPIEGYEYIYWIPGKQPEPDSSIYTPSTRVTIEKLTPSEQYAFKVRAKSRGGSSPWCDPLRTFTKPSSAGGKEEENIYGLKIILHRGKSYLGWTPLPEHKGRVAKFRLTYKISTTDRWEYVEEPPERFSCPPSVVDREYCYDLSGLQSNIQYTSDILYQLSNGEWSRKGNPLFFILVEGGPSKIPDAPNMMSIVFKTDTTAEVSWLPPLSELKIDEYKITARVLSSQNPRVSPGMLEFFRTPGHVYKYLLENILPDTVYNISVEAGSEGLFGPAVWELVSAVPAGVPEIREPRVHQRGEVTTVSWEVFGSIQRLCCFQVDLRSDRDPDWRPYGGGDIPYQDTQRAYSIDLRNLYGNTRYYVRVRAVGLDRSNLCISPSVGFTTQCNAPRSPPNNVVAQPIDARTILLTWTPPDRSTWGCPDIWYNVEGQTNGGRPQMFQVRADSGSGYRVEYRIPSEPGTQWRLKVQTANSGGVSPWSQEVFARTESDAYCSTPRLTPQGNRVDVDWTPQGKGQGIVYGYYINYRTSQNPSWQRHSPAVIYRGDNLSYRGTINGFTPGIRVAVRIEVVDVNQKTIYTSPEAVTELTCSAPTVPPANLQITAPDPRHVRITWEPVGRDPSLCPDISYELQVLEPRGAPVQRLNAGQTQLVLDARPGQRWSVQIRAVNSAGHSPWSRACTATTPPAGELITGLTVTYLQGIPVLSWRSVDNVDELVAFYRVEILNEPDPNWKPHSSGLVPYVGSQRPYSVQMPDLPEGRTVQARVVVIDHNNGIAYTSPGIAVTMPPRCRAPDRPPSNLRVQPMGIREIRLVWTPLGRNEWNCDRLWYIVKYSADRTQTQGYKNFTSFDSMASFDSEPNTRWTFSIQAVNPAGHSPWSRETYGQTEVGAPGPIRDLRINPLGPSVLLLTWLPPSNIRDGIVGYDITYKLLSKGMCNERGDKEVTVTSREPTYNLQGLHPHSRYRISIRAKTNVPGEALTDEAITLDGVPSGPPRSLQAIDISSRHLTITFQAPLCEQTNGDIREYEYEISSPADRDLKSNRVPDTKARIDGLNPYTKYKIRVRAFTTQGPGPWSPEITATTLSEELKLAPSLRVIDTKEQSVTLLWYPPQPTQAEISKYKIRYCLGGTGRCSEKEYQLDQIQCTPEMLRIHQRAGSSSSKHQGTPHCTTVSDLEQEKQYDFQVAAHAVDGKSYGPWSNVESTRTGGGPVKILNVAPIRRTDTLIEIRWTIKPSDQPRVRGFRIIVHPMDNKDLIGQYKVDGSVFQYTIDELTPKTEYNVSVQARTDSDYHLGTWRSISTEDSKIPVAAHAPIIVEKKFDSVTIEWQAPRDSTPNLMGYLVEYRVESVGPPWLQHGSMVPHSQDKFSYRHTVDNLPPNTEVSFRIRLVGRNNVRSEPSPEATARTDCGAPTSPPQLVKLDPVCATGHAASPSLIVSWQKPPQSTWRCDQIAYEISYSTEKQPSEQVIKVQGSDSEYTFPATPFTRWNVKLRSVNRAGQSQWSPAVDVVTCEGVPGPVVDLNVKPLSPNEVLVTWLPPVEKTGQILGYDVSMRLKHRLACTDEKPRDVSQAWFTVYNVKDLKYTLTGLLPFSEYEVKVRARGTTVGPEEMRLVQTHQQAPSAPPLDLKSTYILERSLGFSWQPVECSQRHGYINNYEYEIAGQDNWAKLEVRIANTSQLKVDIDGLTPYTKYIMRVKAYNSVGGGPATADLEVTTAKAAAPLPPQDLTVMSEGADFVAVSWLPPYPPYGPIDSYKIRYAKDGRKHPGSIDGLDWTISQDLLKSDYRIKCPQATPEMPRLCYNITGLESGNAYRIQVAARIEGGSYGPWSQSVVANTLMPLPDTVKSIRLVTKTTDSLTIAWIPPDDPYRRITEYKVTIEPESKREPLRQFIVDHPTTEHMMDGLTPETLYSILVYVGVKRTFGPGVSASYSTETLAPLPLTTAPIIKDKGPRHLTVEWPAIDDPKNRISGYILEYRRLQEPNWLEFGGVTRAEPGRKMLQQKIVGLEPDTPYLVRVKVMYLDNRLSEPSPQVEGRTDCQAPTSAPTNFEANAPYAVQVRTLWRPPPKSTWQCSNIDYQIEYRNGTATGPRIVDLPGVSNEHTFDSRPFTKWFIRIRAKNSVGHSPWSDEIAVTTPEGAPGPVTGVTGESVGPDRIKVQWDPPKEPNGPISGYIITYVPKSRADCTISQSGQSFVQQPITKFVQGGEKETLKDLEPATAYEITVRAKTSVEGPASEPIIVHTQESIPSGPPIKVEASTVHKTSATFTWDEPLCEHRNGKILKYEYNLNGLDPWVLQGQPIKGVVSGERFEAQNLIPYTRYQFLVKAVNSKGAGPFAEPVTITTKPGAPPPPTDVQADELLPTAVSLSFLPPYPAHGILDEYRIRYTPSDRINWQEVRKSPDELACSGARPERLCHRVIEMEPLKEYIVQIGAHTKDGEWGEYSHSKLFTTTEPDIPVPERNLYIRDIKSDSVTAIWDGLPAAQLKNVNGYVLEYNQGGRSEWVQHNDVIPVNSIQGGQVFTEVVKNLVPDTIYFFHLKVVDKRGRRGQPGPDEKAKTLCGKPSQPPRNVKVVAPTYNSVKVSWQEPPKDTWKCKNVIYVLKYQNDTTTGYVELDAEKTEHEFYSHPATKWTIEMKTQTVDEFKEKGDSSDWSPPQTVTTPRGLPDQIDLDCISISHDQAKCTWELPKDDDWSHGVDFTYQLKQLGNCPPKFVAPVTEFNVQNRQYLLQKLEPYSLYTITVTPRIPSHLAKPGVRPPSSTIDLRTQEKSPTGSPKNVRTEDILDKSITFLWEPPDCEKQNGEINSYEYQLVGVDPWAKNELRQSKTQRRRMTIKDLQPGTMYRFQVRAYTTAGPGPYSEPIDVRTTGSSIGTPQEIHPLTIGSRQIAMTWRPPLVSRAPIDGYRIRYSGGQQEVTLRLDELLCHRYSSPLIVQDSLCYTLTGLNPKTTYDIEIQAKSQDTWGPWSSPTYITTTHDVPMGEGSLKVIYTDSESIKVRWEPPEPIKQDITYYVTSIYDPNDGRNVQRPVNVSKSVNEHHYRNLEPNHQYNITVEGGSSGKPLFFISRMFRTSDKGSVCSDYIEAPTNLMIVEKTDEMMRISWSLPSSYEDDSLRRYQVNVSHFDPLSSVTTHVETYTVEHPDNQVNMFGLKPTSVYNISIQSFTSYQPSCDVLWGAFSTLDPPGKLHILRLKTRTTKTLHVYWTVLQGVSSGGYILDAKPLWTMVGPKPVSVRQEAGAEKTDHLITQLTPATIYNVTLTPKNQGQVVAWGVYSTLPRGAMIVSNLKVCDETPYAFSLSWDPIEDISATQYQVRYSKVHTNAWTESPHISHVNLRCPGDLCGKHCYLIFNLDATLSSYVVQVRARVEDVWNNWKTTLYVPSPNVHAQTPYNPCCIVPPDYYVANIGVLDTMKQVMIKPVPNDTYVRRYYLIVDERDIPGPIDETTLFDKITARRRYLPYYIAAAFDRKTLFETEGRAFSIGDGQVHGGYLNYPLKKDKKYNWAFMTVWDIDGQPLVGYYRDYVHSAYIGGGWPWWWLLLLLLLLLLLILLLCCLCWCLSGRYRRRKRIVTRMDAMSGAKQPLLRDVEGAARDSEMSRNLKNLESRIDHIRSQLETKIQSGGVAQESRDGDRDTDSSCSVKGTATSISKRAKLATKGDYEEGYKSGFLDAQKLPSGSVARRHMDDEYGTMRGDFHAGYIQGLRDAGMQGLSQSMQHLAMSRAPRDAGGYSAGYMQGFRDGDSGIFGKKLSITLLNRLEEQYPNQPEFKQGYIDGFKDATRDGEKKLAESVNYLSDRISTLERSKIETTGSVGGGDEIHSTKIYHVYNQLPEASQGYQATGQRLAQELEELSEFSSKKSTLRKHYTPGDYLKYASDTEGGSLQRRYPRRSMSASNLAQEDYRMRTTERSTKETSVNQYNDTYSRRYNYRARSDLGSASLPRRYPSQTILDGVRPGPATPHYREAVVETLQRELGSLSTSARTGAGNTAGGVRTPAGYRRAGPLDPLLAYTSSGVTGYSSDTGGGGAYNVYDTVKSGREAGAGGDFRYTSSQSYSKSEKQTYGVSPTAGLGGVGGSGRVGGAPVGPQLSVDSTTKYTTAAPSPSSTAGVLGGTRNIPVQIATSGRSAVTGSPMSSLSSPDPYRGQSSATGLGTSSQQKIISGTSAAATSIGGRQAAGSSSLNQAYNLFGVSSTTAAESSGSEAEKPPISADPRDASWTDELMRIAQEPMPQTMERMKNYSASLSRMPPSPSPRRTATDYPSEQRGGEEVAKETLAESYSAHYKEERGGNR